ncbi:MAG: MAPEG family protein [Burkholderiaceae bacterium]|nr:MAPEG family protein [Burkholderiaceae bacterium]
MKDAAILYPVFALAAWTLLVLMRLAVTRFRSELTPFDFAIGESERVPMKARLANRNYQNLLELPVLFYVVCLLLYVGDAASGTAVWLAWAYVVLRMLHSLVHLTYNNVMHRFAFFALSNFCLLALWIAAAMSLGLAS